MAALPKSRVQGPDGQEAETGRALPGTRADAGPVERIELQLALLARALEAAQKKRVYPLERAHYLLIDLIERTGPLPVGELARQLLLDDSTVTRQIGAMAELGLIKRTASREDRRIAVIDVTAKARSLAAETRSRRRGRIDVLLQDWSEDERLSFAHMIERLNAGFYGALRET